MDPRLLNYYNQELQFVRETGAEFAADYPKIAGRLGIDEFECADPYVERLFEGFALLAARIQLKLDAEFPRFTQHLLEMVCPHYLAPQPSMAVVEFQPDLTEGGLADGFTLPRHTVLKSLLGKGEQTRCLFRTAHDVTLWPIRLTKASYFPRDVAVLNLPDHPSVKAALVIRLESTAGLQFSDLSLRDLPVFIRGGTDVPMRIYEQIMSGAIGIAVRNGEGGIGNEGDWDVRFEDDAVRPVGFGEDESLIPFGSRSFSGYRLLQEYFAFPQRYMFAEFKGLDRFTRSCPGTMMDIAILMDRSDAQLANRVDESHFSLFSCPAVNVFEKRCDRIHMTDRFAEHQVIPDRTRPVDFEVYQIQHVHGYGTSESDEREFHPFYSMTDSSVGYGDRAFYTINRKPRMLSGKQRQSGPRSSYIGSETYLSLVDAKETPLDHDLRQLAVKALCTNRDLPLQMPVGIAETDFTLEVSAPVESIRCLVGPTKPQPSRSYEKGQSTWRLISHLSLNYLSLCDGGTSMPGQDSGFTQQSQGASALREMLSLYSDANDVQANKQIDGVRTIESRPVNRPISSAGPLSFARGLEVTLTLDESAFEGTGAFLLGAVLREFFAKYVSINSFTETVLRTTERGEVMRWPARMGRRHLV
ncbi:MAG: type VI secretion system baseplate subunit TssF [Planctomycetota bacterium]